MDSLRVEDPSDQEKDEGVVARFEQSGDDFKARGVVTYGTSGLAVTLVKVVAPGGVTRRMLNALRLVEVLDSVRETRTGSSDVLGDVRRLGNVAMSDDLLRDVALVYLEECGPGKGRGATRRSAVRFERTEGTMRAWIGRARAEGWLGPGAVGRMGPEPGPRLAEGETSSTS